jgi:hypothetical protein
LPSILLQVVWGMAMEFQYLMQQMLVAFLPFQVLGEVVVPCQA